MGNLFSYFFSTWFSQPLNPRYIDQDKFVYAVFDPTQHDKPQDRTKDLISVQHKSSPQRQDRVVHQGCDTIWKCFKRTVWCHPNLPFLGNREQINKGKNYAQYDDQVLGEYKWTTFQEIDDKVEALSRVIVKRGFCPVVKSEVEGTPDLKFMGIFSENRPEWVMTELASCSDSICVVPVAVENQFVNEARITSIINKTELTTLCVSKYTIGIITDFKSKELIPTVKNIIMFDQPEDTQLTLATMVGFEIYSFDDLVSEGMKTFDVAKQEPHFDTILILGTTSGTTGEPKQAMLTHLNFVSGQVCQDYLGFQYTTNDVYLSYVPLTHVYEQIMFIDSIMFGFRIGFSSGNLENLLPDIQALKPTILGSFPAFYNKIYSKIQENIRNKPKIFQMAFDNAVQTKIFSYQKYGEVFHPIYDILIFRVIKNILGGNIRFLVSGGAPLSVEIKNFLTVVFQAPIFECYGFTEAAGAVTSTAVWDRLGGHVGGTLPCNRMQLRDVPELGISTDSCPPTGCIYIKGNSVMKGYFKDPERTREVLDEDGWLKVGDVAILNKNGSIQILDRLTEMKKLQSGQFIAPAKLESIYIHAPLINQIYVDVNSSYMFLVAVVTLKEDKLLEYAEVNGLEGSPKELARQKQVEFGVLKQLEKAANLSKLDILERVMRVHIATEPFSQKNGLMTNTQKLKRQEIKIAFRKEIEDMYNQNKSAQEWSLSEGQS